MGRLHGLHGLYGLYGLYGMLNVTFVQLASTIMASDVQTKYRYESPAECNDQTLKDVTVTCRAAVKQR